MKKLLALTLAAALALSLASCGGSSETPGGGNDNTTPDTQETQPPQQDDSSTPPEETGMTKEEMLEIATEEILIDDIGAAFSDNPVRAKQTYCGEVIKFKGYIEEIGEDYILLRSGGFGIKALLPTDVIVDLEKGLYVIVGHLTDMIEESTEQVAGYTFEYSDYTMDIAYVVQDTFTFTGRLLWTGKIWTVVVSDLSKSYIPIYFTDDIDPNAYDEHTITFTAKFFNGCYNEAVLVEPEE